jgi:hypothetical protein
LGRHSREADADAYFKALVIPEEMEFLHCLAQPVGKISCSDKRTVSEQDRQFVTAEPGQRIAAAPQGLQYGSQLTEQFVAGAVATLVIDDFELV